MKLSIIIPVYNEENQIKKVISDVLAAPVKIDKEIIIIDDSSTDNTKSILNKYQNNKKIKIVYLIKNTGKGNAIREGITRSSGDIILIQDADSEYTVRDYPALLEPLLDRSADVVYGSRFKGRIIGMRWQNFLANKILTFVANILYGINLTDEATAYKLFRAKIIKQIPLKSKRFDFCPEVTAKISKRGCKIEEVPISYKARGWDDGKKIKIGDGFVALWTLIKYRFID